MNRLKSILSRRARQILKHWLDVLLVEIYSRIHRGVLLKSIENGLPLPQTLHIEGTNICNAQCLFCAYTKMQRRKQTMPMEQFRRIVDEYLDLGGRRVSLTPIVGDPMVDPFLFERLDYLSSRAEVQSISFYTNAILMTPPVSARLVGYDEKLTVNVSWGGFKRLTYQRLMGVDRLDTVYENVAAFVEHKRRSASGVGLVVAVRCPPSECVGRLWDSLLAFGHENLLGFTTVDEFDSWAGKVSAEQLLSAGLMPRDTPYKKGACELLLSKPVVLADGLVNACACRDVEAELIIGNLKESSFAELWAGQHIKGLIERHESGDFPDVCRRCTYYVSVYNRRKSSVLKTLKEV